MELHRITALKRVAAAAALVTAGVAAAFVLAQPASAWNPEDLARLGYSTDVVGLPGEQQCHEWRATGYGHTANLGSDCDAGFQQRLDDFINTTCPCAQTTASTSTAAATVATTVPATTVAQTTTSADPPPPPPPVTTVVSVTTVVTSPTATTTVTLATADDIARLQAEIDALSARVKVLETRTGLLAVGPTPTGYAPSGIEYAAG